MLDKFGRKLIILDFLSQIGVTLGAHIVAKKKTCLSIKNRNFQLVT